MTMKSILAGILALVLTFGLTACDQPPVQAQAQPKPQPAKVAHHFEPIPNTRGDLAIDTATGLKCKTWEWGCTLPESFNDTQGLDRWNKTPIYGMSCGDLIDLPSCEKLASHD
jgi:hypothetical protein